MKQDATWTKRWKSERKIQTRGGLGLRRVCLECKKDEGENEEGGHRRVTRQKYSESLADDNPQPPEAQQDSIKINFLKI